MPGTYSTYESFPGRQHYVMVVPRAFGPCFFEGIQSMDAANNVNETTHGQYGFKSDVLIAKQYTNTSGSVALKDFNNASFVLRAMTGIEPTNSFIFDSSRLEPVDVFVNIFNDSRDKVMRSCWYVDFTPNVTQNNTLDDIETLTINYTSVRKIDFEGKQIVCQAFTETKEGDFQFKMKWKAVIDPSVQTSVYDSTTGVSHGQGRHDLCPFPYLLRVWVNDEVLDDPDAAQVHTVNTGTVTNPAYESTLVLKQPLPDIDGAGNGPMVKVMWLADGADPVAQEGVSSAAVMVNAEPDIGGTPTTPVWSGKIKVFFSNSLAVDSTGAIVGLTGADFRLTYTLAGGGAETIEGVVVPVTTGLSVTDNVMELDFTGGVLVGGAGAATGSWVAGDEAVLCYVGHTGFDLTDREGHTTPQHCITIAAY